MTPCTASAASLPGRRLQGARIAALTACQALAASCFFLLLTFSGLIGLNLLPPALATFPAAALIAGKAAAIAPASWLITRLGRRRSFLVGAALALAGGLALQVAGAVGSGGLVLFACALIGSFDGFAAFFRYAATDGMPSGKRGMISSVVLLGPLAAALTGPGLAILCGQDAGQQGLGRAGIAISLMAFLSIAILWRYRDESRTARSPTPAAVHLRILFTDSNFWRAATIGMVGMAAMSLVMSGFPAAAASNGLALGHAAHVMQWHAFAMFAPALLAGWMLDRLGPVLVARAGLVLLALAAVVTLSGSGHANVPLSLVLVGIGWNFTFVSATAMVLALRESHLGSSAEGAAETLVCAANLSAAAAAGALLNAFGWAGLWTPFLLLLLAGAAVTLIRSGQ